MNVVGVLKKSEGFSLVEIIIAAGIVMIAATGMTWSIREMSRNRIKSQLISVVMAAESSLAAELLEEANYTAAVKTELNAGTIPPPSLQFTLSGTISSGRPFSFNIRPGQTVNLDQQLNPCVGFPSATCPIQLRLALADIGGRFAYAYRINTLYPEISLSFKGASSAGNGPFAATEYMTTIPYEYYLNSLQIICPPGSVAVKGLSSRTGTVACIRQPQTTCPTGQLPKQVHYNDPTQSFEFDCGVPTRTASCPANYFLQRIDTTTLDNTAGPARPGTPTGTCVDPRRNPSTDNVTYGGAGTRRIAGQACAPGYRSASTCTVHTTSQTNGVCPNWCFAWTPNCPGVLNWLPLPAPQQTALPTILYDRSRDFTYSCTRTGNQPMPANGGIAVLSENSPQGYVDCRLRKQNQDCGAAWDGYITLNINCVLDGSRPETVNVN